MNNSLFPPFNAFPTESNSQQIERPKALCSHLQLDSALGESPQGWPPPPDFWAPSEAPPLGALQLPRVEHPQPDCAHEYLALVRARVGGRGDAVEVAKPGLDVPA